jgi:short-subunit dehydrogenase
MALPPHRRRGGAPLGYLPDGALVLPTGERIAVEVELHDKAARLAGKLAWYRGAGYAEVLWLVPSAGVGLYGRLDERGLGELDRMVQLNVGALTALTRLALPAMRARRWGRILNVASVMAYQPGAPWMATYYATKAYVLSFSRGLAAELVGTGVSVTVLAPGPTGTGFDAQAGAEVDAPYNRLPKMAAAAVARAGYDGMKRGREVVLPGLLTKLLAVTGELPPRGIALAVSRRLWRPREAADT